MNSIEVTNSPPIKDENYEKTASLLKVIAASQTPNDSGEDKHTIVWALYMFSRILYPTWTWNLSDDTRFSYWHKNKIDRIEFFLLLSDFWQIADPANRAEN